MAMELHGERAVLRPVADGDVGVLDAIVRKPEVAAWRSPPREYANTFAVLVEGDVVGAVQYSETDPDVRHAGIDVFLTARRHGQGLGADAVRTPARRLVRERGHHRPTIDPAAADTVAVRCYRKVGFRPVGILRAYTRDPRTGTWQDGLLMDQLAEELG